MKLYGSSLNTIPIVPNKIRLFTPEKQRTESGQSIAATVVVAQLQLTHRRRRIDRLFMFGRQAASFCVSLSPKWSDRRRKSKKNYFTYVTRVLPQYFLIIPWSNDRYSCNSAFWAPLSPDDEQIIWVKIKIILLEFMQIKINALLSVRNIELQN